jgi:hypothetical protein
MAGLSAGPVRPVGTAPMSGTSGYMGGGNPYNPSAQYGSTWGTPTGDAYQSTFKPTVNPQTGMVQGGAWDVAPAGRTLEGQAFDFDKTRWGDTLGMMQDAMRGLSSAGGSGGSLGPAIAPPSMPGRSSLPSWSPDESVSRESFARSKDNVGRMMRAADTDVRDQFGSRGIGGSGLEQKALALLKAEGLRTLAEGENRRDIANEGRQFDMAKLAASIDTGERAQDITGAGNLYATQVAQRGQQPQVDPRISMLASMMSSIGGMY